MIAAGHRIVVGVVVALVVLASLATAGVGGTSPPRGRVSLAAEESLAALGDAQQPGDASTPEPPLIAAESASPIATSTPTLPAVTSTAETATPTPTLTPTPTPERAAPKLTLGVDAAHVGDSLAVTVAGFPPNRRVAIYFDGARKATLVTSPAGSASGTIKLPAAAAGLHEVRANGGASVTKKVRIRPILAVAPASVQAGKPVTVTLTGFAASTAVKIRISDVGGSSTVLSVWAATTGATGSLTQVFTTKTSLPAGKHRIVATDAAANAAGSYLTTTTPRPKPPTPRDPRRSQVFDRGTSGRPEIALTFDAGADRGYAEEILDTLKAYGVKASFGITGQWAKANPDLIRRMAAEGHMIFNHTWSHRSYTGFSTAGWDAGIADAATRLQGLDDTAALIARLTNGYDVRPYFRPPYGDLDASVLGDVASGGYTVTVMWSCDTLGWNGATAAQIVARCGTTAEAGDIILMHVGAESLDAAALPRMIETLQGQGYDLVTVEQLLQR